MPTHPIWPTLSPDLTNEILVCSQKTNKRLYKNVIELIGPNLGMREPKILEMPKRERHLMFAQVLQRPDLEALSFNLISHWLVQEHVPLLCDWLSALGIEHDDKGCANEFPTDPGKSALTKAVKALLKKHDPQLVAIYLRTFVEIDEVQWPELVALIDSMEELKLPEPGAA